jgi:beta-N-acetylhexosaminidase
MVTHVMIPAVDPDLPSSLSPAIIDGVLRQQMGFQGVVITDDVFNMEALSERYPGPQAAVLAVVAGADEIIGPSSPQTVRQTIDAMKQAMASGQLTKERIDLSVRRILTLKIQMGLIPLPKTATPTPTPSPSPKPHASTDHATYRSSQDARRPRRVT